MHKKLKFTADTQKPYYSKQPPESFAINTNDFNSVVFELNVTQNGAALNLEGASVKLAIRKPDKNVTYQSGSVAYAAGGDCTFTLASQSYVMPGLHTAEVMIQYPTDEIIVSRAFPFVVERGILNDSAVESTNWYQDIHDLSDQVEVLADEVEKALAETEEARQAASRADAAAATATAATTTANQAAAEATDAAQTATEATEAAETATGQAQAATTATNEAISGAVAAKQGADAATTNANQATEGANAAATGADEAAGRADAAAGRANQAATNATDQTQAAIQAAQEATQTAVSEANTATQATKDATGRTEQATSDARGAIEETQAATLTAQESATEATEAAQTATTAAGNANAKAGDAATQAAYAKTQGDYAKQEGEKVAAIGKASATKDGFMSKEDFTALANAQKYRMTDNDGRARTLIGETDLNSVVDAGIFMTSTQVNSPFAGYSYWYFVEVLKHNNSYVTQRATRFAAGGDTRSYIRQMDAGTWLPWRRMTDVNMLGNLLIGNKLADQITGNFSGKTPGNIGSNPHIAKRAATSQLDPNAAGWIEAVAIGGTGYERLQSIDGISFTQGGSANNQVASHLFSFDLISQVERTYGMIPGSAKTEKINWLKSNISKLTFNWWGFGNSTTGYKSSVGVWHNVLSSWNAFGTATHTNASVSKLNQLRTSDAINLMIDANGYVHFIAYAEPSDGVTPSIINTDYVELQIELSTDIKTNVFQAMKPTWIDATLQNGWLDYDASMKPKYSLGSDGFVTLKGVIKSGTLPGTAFTLPAGFRPLQNHYGLITGGSGDVYRFTIGIAGTVYINQVYGSGGNTQISLDGIRFATT